MSEMAEKSCEQYFFGFGQFFGFKKPKGSSVGQRAPQTSYEAADMIYSVPIRLEFSEDEVQDVALFCITWSTIFRVLKTNGMVSVCGWGQGQSISAKENICLPLADKIVLARGSWNQLVLISQTGSCYVLRNVQADWTVCRVTGQSRETNEVDFEERKFSVCDIGDTHCIAVDRKGKVYEIEEDEKTEASSTYICFPVALDVVVDEVSCGKEHVILLNKEQGTVYSFGLGSRGQLGLGQLDPERTPKLVEALAGIRIQQIAAGGWHSLALSEFGDVYAWGWNECGQLGITCVPPEVPSSFQILPYIVDFPGEVMVARVACGARHSGAVTTQGGVWTWGWGFYGQLGHGDTQDRKTPTVVKYFKDVGCRVSDITCGPWQTVVGTENTGKT